MDSALPARLIAIWEHSGRQAELVRELKYGRATSVVTELADAMAERAPLVDIVTWVPASIARRRRRGFDQGELLARAVARRRGVRVRRLLRRRDDVAQTSRDLEGRLVGPEFVSAGRRLRLEPRVLLIDDVCTTGSTLRAAALVLHRRGAGEIVGLVATRAIPRSGSAKSLLGVYDWSTSKTHGG